jgi:hypothetical protein
MAKYARDHAAEVTLEPGWGLGGGQAEKKKTEEGEVHIDIGVGMRRSRRFIC